MRSRSWSCTSRRGKVAQIRPDIKDFWLKRIYLLIGLLLLLVVPRVSAQSDAVTLEVAVGFGGTIKAGAWAPVTITATNTGSDMRGSLVWRWTSGGTRFAQSIDLPRGAKKQLVLPVLADSFADSFGSGARLELLDGTRVVESTPVRYNQLDSSSMVVGVLSDAGASLPELAGLPGMFGGTTTLVRLNAATLPERWELLQTLDILFVHATDTTTWSDAQRRAVEMWVADGGRVVVGGDQPATATGIGPLLPASVGERAGEASLADLRPALNWGPRAGSPAVPVLGLEPQPGATVVAESSAGLPLIVRRAHGRGALIQAAFDLAVPSTQGEPLALWQRLLPQSGTQQFQWQQLRQNGDSVLREALALPALRLPSIWTLLGFLGFYIFLVGPANYLLLRRFDRREWAYLTIPLTVGIFTLGAYGLGAAGRGGAATVTALSVVRVASNSDTGRALTYLGIFSPARRNYEVSMGPEVLVSNTSFFGRANDLQVVRGEAAVELPGFLVDVGALRPLVVEQPEVAPLVEVTLLDESPTALRLAVENRSDIRLEDAAVSVGESIYKIPEIAARETRTVELDLSQPVVDQDFDSNGVIERAAAINALRWSFFTPIQPMPMDPMLPGQAIPLAVPAAQERLIYLMAWTATTQIKVALNGVQQEVRGETLFLWTAAKAQ